MLEVTVGFHRVEPRIARRDAIAELEDTLYCFAAQSRLGQGVSESPARPCRAVRAGLGQWCRLKEANLSCINARGYTGR
jgi:hypothetical protein